MITGNLAAQSFFPRARSRTTRASNNDPDNMGHNTDFLTRAANNVIFILNDSQLNQLKRLAVSQQVVVNEYGLDRFLLMKAFQRLIDDVPAGSSGLNRSAVIETSRGLYLIDGQLSFERALAYKELYGSLNSTQVAYLDAMKGKGFNSWPNITDSQIRYKMRQLPPGSAVAVMTYAGDLLSWWVGSMEADVYFCLSDGTYYGSFYIKDAPAVGHAGYSISEQLTATAGSGLCDSSEGYVTQDQASLISSLVEIQRKNMYLGEVNIVLIRTLIAGLLRQILNSTMPTDEILTQVLPLSATYGELDGENNYNYATVFAVYKSLTSSQKTTLIELNVRLLCRWNSL